MKKQLVLTTLILSTLLIGCGTNSNVSKNTEAVTEASTETTHKHNYTETITAEATCETEGETTYTCECGDTYTEVIKATGHSFTNYVSNNDATYEADGTKTAKCDNCDATDTRTAEGSKLTYTFTDMDATKYAKSTVNVRSLPTADSEKLGGLSTNNEVKVTGQCNETGWYRIEYNNDAAYVSDSYLVDNKIETKKTSSQNTSSAQTDGSQSSAPAQSTSTEFPYELYTLYDNGTYYYYYSLESEGTTKPEHWYAAACAAARANCERYPSYEAWGAVRPAKDDTDSGYTFNGEKVLKSTWYVSQEQLPYLVY